MTADTIYALSSGMPPAALAVVRISGPRADDALRALAGRLPAPRRASLARLRHPRTGETLDEALLLRFPGPGSATGEDLVELHLHGGRAVVRAVCGALAGLDSFREAEPGEFTRRAFENGRIDLAEAEGLADLLAAETESQRRAALALAGGALSRHIGRWRDQLLVLAAGIEATLDFSDEEDVGEPALPEGSSPLDMMIRELEALLDRPSTERLRDGVRVVIAGPPNAGKSTLFNCLVGREAAITSPVAGTTRDIVEAPVAIGGQPFLLIDTAGLRDSDDIVENIGVERARNTIASADIILWLGDPAECSEDPARTILVEPKADLRQGPCPASALSVSSTTGAGIHLLTDLLLSRSRTLLPQEGEVAMNHRHHALLGQCLSHIRAARMADDSLIAAEALRQARVALDRVTGGVGVEDMLDALFGRFCIGK